MWWALNCKYNAAYDVQRMNTKCANGDMALNEWDDSNVQERFLFTSNNADLVAYMMALRTELQMRMVMPEIECVAGAGRY